MWNRKLWSEAEYAERMRVAELMFNYAMELCLIQSRNGLYFTLENPVAASSWGLPLVQEALGNWANTQSVNFDQCRLGLVSPSGRAIKKRTKFLTNSARVVHHFSQMQCHCVTPHMRVQGNEGRHRLSTWCQVYPEAMCDLLVTAAHES
jgi:hypothetical protein